MTIEYKPSDAHIVKAVPVSDDAPYGVKEVQAITPNRPSLVVFGGELTDCARHANHYVKQMHQILDEHNMSGVDVYSVYYDFGSRDSNLERRMLFRNAGRRLAKLDDEEKIVLHMRETEATPKYIEKLYKILCEPLLAQNATNNASKLRFYAHSHGAAAIYMLGKYMARQMQKNGFSATEINTIQKNIVAIQHGPIAPLENPNFMTLSFASASDTRMDMHNIFSKYVYLNAENLYPSYFNQCGMHLFVGGQLKNNFRGEHDNTGMLKSEKELLTSDGEVILAAERNAIINSLKAAKNNQPTPTVSQMVSGNGVDFQEMKSNGEWFYQTMLNDVKNRRV